MSPVHDRTTLCRALCLFVVAGSMTCCSGKWKTKYYYGGSHALFSYWSAQLSFRHKPRYPGKSLRYANSIDGAGFADLYELDGEVLGLINEKLASAVSPLVPNTSSHGSGIVFYLAGTKPSCSVALEKARRLDGPCYTNYP